MSLANRIVMAPLTRNHAETGRVPGALQVEYYRQRGRLHRLPGAGAGRRLTRNQAAGMRSSWPG